MVERHDEPGHTHADEVLAPLDEVQRLVLSRCGRLGRMEVALVDAVGSVLAEDIIVGEDIPPFANTAMDGYAVRAADTAAVPVELHVVGILAAGQAPPTAALGPGEALQIMTGAPMPPGADAVAIVERTEPVAGGRVRVLDRAEPGSNVRPAGSDFPAGTVALTAGTLLGPAHLGVLSSVGRSMAPVWRRPVVGVMSTGDELVEPGEPLGPGQIRDSNRVTIGALVRSHGFPVVDLGTVRDTEEAVSQALEGAFERCDVVLSSGGVSKGEFDFVKVVLDRMATTAAVRGGESFELAVGIRPAKPLALAWLPRPAESLSAAAASSGLPGESPEPGAKVAFFGLPGNPVSAVVSYLVIALPAIRQMAGYPEPLPHAVPAVAAEALRPSRDGRLNLLRVEARISEEGRLTVRSAGGQQSHQLSGLSSANALALVPSGQPVDPGDQVQVIFFGPLP